MEGLPPQGTPIERLPHAALDDASRRKKARKIGGILGPHIRLEGARALDIGTGSGHVAAMLSELVGERGEVWGIDTVDQRRCTEGFRFSLVTDPSLPFKDGYFDLVISNHVVEHVGERQDQLRHLREIARVLNRSGIGYIATPNRWTIIEPHYKLPFLSWPPPSLRTPYLKAIRRSSPYDCNPLSSSRISDLFRQAGLDHEDVTLEALRFSADVESDRIARLIMGAPRGLVHIVRPVIPTMIYLVKKG